MIKTSVVKNFLPQDYQDIINLYFNDGLYNPNYVVYDDYGVRETHCQRCGTVVIRRGSETIQCPRCDYGFLVESKQLKELSNLVRVRKDLDNRKYIELLLCKQCAVGADNLTEEEEKRIMAQLCYGWVKEMKLSKRPDKDIQKHIDKKIGVKFVRKEGGE